MTEANSPGRFPGWIARPVRRHMQDPEQGHDVGSTPGRAPKHPPGYLNRKPDSHSEVQAAAGSRQILLVVLEPDS